MSTLSLATPGSILWCINWPLYNKKPRPVLVIRRIHDINGLDWVLAVYGTGEKTSEKNSRYANKPGTFEIKSSDCRFYNLSEATLFDFNCIVPIELNIKNFSQVKPKLRGTHFDIAVSLFQQKQNEIKSLI